MALVRLPATPFWYLLPAVTQNILEWANELFYSYAVSTLATSTPTTVTTTYTVTCL